MVIKAPRVYSRALVIETGAGDKFRINKNSVESALFALITSIFQGGEAVEYPDKVRPLMEKAQPAGMVSAPEFEM